MTSMQHSDHSEFVASACATLALLSDVPVVQIVIAKKSSIEAITRALMKNFTLNTLVQQTSRMLANSVKKLTDPKRRQVGLLLHSLNLLAQTKFLQDIVRSLMPFVFARMIRIHIGDSGES